MISPLGSLSAYFGANSQDFFYAEKIIGRISTLDEREKWNDKNAYELKKSLSKFTRIEKSFLVRMCNQILNEEWDEFSIITGYSIKELKELKALLRMSSDQKKIGKRGADSTMTDPKKLQPNHSLLFQVQFCMNNQRKRGQSEGP